MSAGPPSEQTEETEAKRLLVVDDDVAILKLLKTLLSRANYRVASCASAFDALKLLSMGEYDLMITDAIMPEMNGFELVRAVRKNPSFGDLPILMLTRRSDRTDVKKALEAGVTDYVLKPIDEHLLLDKVAVSLKNHGSDNRLREVSIHGKMSYASVQIDARIISMRETGVIIRFPFAITEGTAFKIETQAFLEIGIKPPIMKMIACELKPSSEAEQFRDFPWQAEFSFVGVSEANLKKIRTWLQKQEIQRKK